MSKKLLGSRTRLGALKLFMFNPKQEYYIRQISRLINEPFDPLRRELIHLESIGLLKSRQSGRQKYYSINANHTLFPEFKSIILKTVGIGDVIRAKLKEKADITIAFVYGSYAKNAENTESDIDLFVIGDISSRDLQGIISSIENATKREINTVVYAPKEFEAKYNAKNNFITSVLKEPKIFLKGDEDALRKLVRGRQTH